jgi:hypothetical protein
MSGNNLPVRSTEMDTHMHIQLCVYLLCIIRAICFIAYLSNACRKKNNLPVLHKRLKLQSPYYLITPNYIRLYSFQHGHCNIAKPNWIIVTTKEKSICLTHICMTALFLSWHRHFNKKWRCLFSLMCQCNDACKPDGRPCISVLINHPLSKLLSDV